MPLFNMLALCLMLVTANLISPAHANDAFLPDIRTTPPTDVGVAPAVVTQASQTLPSHPAFRQAVQQYRQGDYATAYGQFAQLVADYPEEMAYTYYQALAATQLQRYPEAQQLYQHVLWLVPNTPLAQLAQQGLQTLPLATNATPANAPLTMWDAPPATPVAGQPAQSASSLTKPTAGGVSAQAFASNPYGRPVQPQGQMGQGNAVSPEMLQQQMQAMMMMQMMAGMGGNTPNADPTGMGMGGMGQGWGINPMMNPAMNPMGNPMTGQTAMDPNVMSQLMMNQLMGNTMGAMESDRDR